MPKAIAPNQLQERKIAKMYDEGYTAKEIGNALGIETSGVEMYQPKEEKKKPGRPKANASEES